MQRPDPIIALLETEVVLPQRVGDEKQALRDADGPGAGHMVGREVPRMLDRGEPACVVM